MLTEAAAPPVQSEQPYSSPEVEYKAEDFCQAYQDVVGLLKHGLRVAETRFKFDNSDLKKVENVIQSQPLRNYLNQAVSNGHYPSILHDEQMRAYIIDMACTGVFGRIVELERRRDQYSVPRLYKERIIDMNHAFVGLADSELGNRLGIGRTHMKKIIGFTFGAHLESEEVGALERGVAVEVGTKKCVQELAFREGIQVRWSTPQEDARNVDIVCVQNHKTLGLQIKSKDQTSGSREDRHAFYTPIEEYGPHEYRVRQLSPAADTAIGEHYEVRAARYRDVIESLLADFSQLH